MNDKRFTFQPSLQQNAEAPTPLETYMQNNTNMSSQMLNKPATMFMSMPVAPTMPASNNQPATAQINMSSLIDAGYQPPKSIGLPIHNLIEPSTMAPKDGPVATVEPQFNPLVGVDPNYQPQQKFAIQPSPVDIDRSMLPKPAPVNSVMEDATAHLNKAQAQDYSVGKKLNNWFTRLLDQRGQDYIDSGKLSIDEVSKNAEKILDDMIAGRVDYIKQGSVLINPIIIDTLINYCANKLAINRAIQFALGYVYNDYTNKQCFYDDPNRMANLAVIDDSMSRNITQSIAIVNQDIGVYDILYKKLTFVEATKNVSSLFSLTNELNAYKKQLKKRY